MEIWKNVLSRNREYYILECSLLYLCPCHTCMCAKFMVKMPNKVLRGSRLYGEAKFCTFATLRNPFFFCVWQTRNQRPVFATKVHLWQVRPSTWSWHGDWNWAGVARWAARHRARVSCLIIPGEVGGSERDQRIQEKHRWTDACATSEL